MSHVCANVITCTMRDVPLAFGRAACCDVNPALVDVSFKELTYTPFTRYNRFDNQFDNRVE